MHGISEQRKQLLNHYKMIRQQKEQEVKAVYQKIAGERNRPPGPKSPRPRPRI